MTFHTCGDSALDPGNCPACREDPPPSPGSYAKAMRALDRSFAGLCLTETCEKGAEEESAYCRECFEREVRRMTAEVHGLQCVEFAHEVGLCVQVRGKVVLASRPEAP